MKKIALTLSLSLILTISGLIPAVAQEQPKPQKDTVNLDTDAKPTQYYAVEDEKTEADKGAPKSSAVIIIGIAAAVIVVGGIIFFLLKKKK
jgi:uncharacterized protein YjeT (DUF2065 family)